jgi:hypothetical protein
MRPCLYAGGADLTFPYSALSLHCLQFLSPRHYRLDKLWRYVWNRTFAMNFCSVLLSNV